VAGAWFGGLLVMAAVIVALACLRWVRTSTRPAWLHGDIGGAAPRSVRVPISPTLRASVWLRDGGCCTLCGQRDRPGNILEIDHWYPVALGGQTVLSNLRLVHRTLNEAKGARWPWTDSPSYCLAA
jgi:hypothetical protein